MHITELLANCLRDIETLNWTPWQPLHEPLERGKGFDFYTGTGVYQLRDSISLKKVLSGTGKNCNERMSSLYPAPFGKGNRNNGFKRMYVYENWQQIEVRVLATPDIFYARFIESALFAANDHIFNT